MIYSNKEKIAKSQNKRTFIFSYIIILNFIIVIIFTLITKVDKYYCNKMVVTFNDNNYYFKLYIDFVDLNNIISHDTIRINEKDYKYQIISLSDLEVANYNNYYILYIEILDIDEKLLINNLVIDYKILIGKQKLITYLKNKMEE